VWGSFLLLEGTRKKQKTAGRIRQESGRQVNCAADADCSSLATSRSPDERQGDDAEISSRRQQPHRIRSDFTLAGILSDASADDGRGKQDAPQLSCSRTLYTPNMDRCLLNECKFAGTVIRIHWPGRNSATGTQNTTNEIQKRRSCIAMEKLHYPQERSTVSSEPFLVLSCTYIAACDGPLLPTRMFRSSIATSTSCQ